MEQDGISERACITRQGRKDEGKTLNQLPPFFVHMSRNALKRRYRAEAIPSFVAAGLLVIIGICVMGFLHLQVWNSGTFKIDTTPSRIYLEQLDSASWQKTRKAKIVRVLARARAGVRMIRGQTRLIRQVLKTRPQWTTGQIRWIRTIPHIIIQRERASSPSGFLARLRVNLSDTITTF